MELLFGRFPHLVENIFSLLDAETLFHCSRIDKIWNGNLEEYRCYLVKKIQKHLKNPSIINGTPSDFDKEEGQIRGIYPAVVYPTRDKRRNFTVEQLPLVVLVQFMKYFCNSEIKDRELNFRILCTKNTSVIMGVFIKEAPNSLGNSLAACKALVHTGLGFANFTTVQSTRRFC